MRLLYLLTSQNWKIFRQGVVVTFNLFVIVQKSQTSFASSLEMMIMTKLSGQDSTAELSWLERMSGTHKGTSLSDSLTIAWKVGERGLAVILAFKKSSHHTKGEYEESIARRIWGEPLWLWNPRQTSPEVQNRGIVTKRANILQKYKIICLSEESLWLQSY